MPFKKLLALAVLSAAIGGCSASPPTDPSNDAAIGRYALKIVSGRIVPFTTPGGAVITDGVIYLSSDGTYSSAAHQATTHNGATVVETIGLPRGSWSRVTATLIRLTPVNGDELAVDAIITLPSLNFRYSNSDWGYVKQ